jgi:hypothetical protein
MALFPYAQDSGQGRAAVVTVGGFGQSWIASDNGLTRPANTTAYAAQQALGSANSCLFKWTNFFQMKGQTGVLVGLRLVVNAAGIATSNMGNVRAHLFSQAPSGAPAADQAVYNELVANAPNKQAIVDFSTWNIGGASSDMIDSYGTPPLSPQPVAADPSAKDLYCLLVATGAFTPIASAVITPYASGMLD